MIVRIRELIHKLQTWRKPTQYEYIMKFDGNEFVPTIASTTENTMSIKSTITDGSELVGLSIVATFPSSPSMQDAIILTNNGLFVNISEVKATDVMIFTSTAEAKDIVQELPHHVITASNNQSYIYHVFAAYQNRNRNALSFRKVW